MVIDTLADVREMYGESYQRDSAELRRLEIWRGFARIFQDVFSPRSFCDVGCGAGGLVMAMREAGCPKTIGFEGADVAGLIPGLDIRTADLRYPIPHSESYDLVTCFDVAEHVGAAEVLCDTLRKLTAVRKWLIFGAAEPGQGGLGHCDLRPMSEWTAMLEERGFEYLPGNTDRLKAAMEEVPDQNYLWWVKSNAHVYWRAN